MLTKQNTINIPLDTLKCLYNNKKDNKVVFEIDIKSLKSANNNVSLDEMFNEARLEYFTNQTSWFTDVNKLIDYLEK